MKFALALLGMAAAIKDDDMAHEADLVLDLEWDEDVVAVVTEAPDVEALAALSEEQRWEGYLYCTLNNDACGDLGDWETAVAEACEAGSEACIPVVEFFEEVAEIEAAYGDDDEDQDDDD
jgi:hypothetical protein